MLFRSAFGRRWLLCAGLWGCSPSGGASAGADTPSAADLPAGEARTAAGTFGGPGCAAFSETTGPLPNVDQEQLTLEYWLAQLGKSYDLDRVLLSPAQIAALNQSLQVPRDDYHAPLDLLGPFDVALLTSEVNDRRTWARDKLGSGEYVGPSGAKLPSAALAPLDVEPSLAAAPPALRVALVDAQIHCAPLAEHFYSTSLDLRLDRNACSTLRAQEVVRVVAAWPNGMQLVQSATSFGWLAAGAALSEPLSPVLAEAYVRGASLEV
ncbi:MAG TPA: hypothetical protein VJU61_28000, partial [Polyangiaceae bacterium]|nr:hypothetical protein [Polyangiaceae bacterium]